jgi:predicted ATP-grasp superfamily ATP-dependent carboligase/FMN phosphatase YigB (HAD superfamily)
MTTGEKHLSNLLSPHTIVLASIGSRKALAIARSLKTYGAKVVGITHYVLDPHRFSRLFEDVIILNGVNRKSSLWALLVAKIASEHKAELVIPVDFIDIVTFSSHEEVFSKLNVRLASPSATAILKAARKDLLIELVGDLVNVPRSLFCNSPSEISLDDAKNLRLPLVVKGTGDASNPEYFSSYMLAVRRARERAPCLIQEYIAGICRGYYAVAFNGEVFLEFTHERIYEYDPSGGASAAARGPILDPRLYELGRGIIRRLNWTGPLMVETRYVPATGEYYLLELNPKFWGSLALPVSLGYHFPAVLAIAYLKGREVARNVSKNLLVQSGEYYFTADSFHYALKIPKTWIRMLVSSRIIKSDIDLKDPARTIMQFIGTALQAKKLRREWVHSLRKSLLNLKDTYGMFSGRIRAVIFDLDNTLVKLKVPWDEVKLTLNASGLIYRWETVREGFARLWHKDRIRYNKASSIVEIFEQKSLDTVKPMVDIDAITHIKNTYKLTYCIVTFQSELVAKDILKKIGLHNSIDLVLGRDSGLGPFKGDLYRKCLEHLSINENAVVFDDEIINTIYALELGCLPILVTEERYEGIKALRLGILSTEPRHLHDFINIILKVR